jgi:hypothetical protein
MLLLYFFLLLTQYDSFTIKAALFFQMFNTAKSLVFKTRYVSSPFLTTMMNFNDELIFGSLDAILFGEENRNCISVRASVKKD